MLPGNIRSVLDTELYWDYPVLQRNDDIMKVTAPVSIHVLGKNEADQWIQKTERAEITEEISMDHSCSCKAMVLPGCESYAVLTAGGAEVNAAATLVTSCCTGNTLKTLSGGEIEEEDKCDHSSPSLIVKTVDKNTPLWDLAKTYRTTEHRIKSANRLDTDHIPEDMLVLLPLS